MSTIELLEGCCLEIMKGMHDDHIDLTITSPPYDNLRIYNGHNKYWNENVWKNIIQELYRVTKQGGIVVWVVGDATIKGSETGTSFKQALWGMECGFNLHDTMIYNKKNPVPLKSNRYNPSFEYMFIFSKGKPKTFNPIKERKINNSIRKKSFNREKDGKHKQGKTSSDLYKTKNNIWSYVVGGNHITKDEIAYGHPAIFPEQLAEDHIISWSNKDDTVFDPMMGSGTTGKMALLNGRNFIGIELDHEYFGIAEKRINLYRTTGI